jgi:aminoglycoside 3-N-acetyltransferase
MNSELKLSLTKMLPIGSDIFLHSSFKSIGLKYDVTEFIKVMIDVIGEDGTLTMPAFTFQFNQEKYFNPAISPCGTGIVPETFRKMTISGLKVQRNLNPMQSIVSWGKHSDQYINALCETTFGKNSAFELLLNNNATLMLLGCDYNKITFYHYLEELLLVPYRYWKTFEGIIENNGVKNDIKYKMYVRELQYIPNINHYGLELEKLGKVQQYTLGNSIVRLVKIKDLFEFLLPLMQKDPYCLVRTNRDEWVIQTTIPSHQ